MTEPYRGGGDDPMTERHPHPSHVTASGPGHVTGLDRTPAGHGPRCSVCAPPATSPAPDCPHGMYRGDWCDGCGTEVPYPPVEETLP